MDARRTTARDMRRANRSLLLTRLYRDGPLSRQDLVRSTALSQASVSNLAGELIEDGIVEEAGQVESDGGRPRVLLRVAPEYGYVVGVGSRFFTRDAQNGRNSAIGANGRIQRHHK